MVGNLTSWSRNKCEAFEFACLCVCWLVFFVAGRVCPCAAVLRSFTHSFTPHTTRQIFTLRSHATLSPILTPAPAQPIELPARNLLSPVHPHRAPALRAPPPGRPCPWASGGGQPATRCINLIELSEVPAMPCRYEMTERISTSYSELFLILSARRAFFRFVIELLRVREFFNLT